MSGLYTCVDTIITMAVCQSQSALESTCIMTDHRPVFT